MPEAALGASELRKVSDSDKYPFDHRAGQTVAPWRNRGGTD